MSGQAPERVQISIQPEARALLARHGNEVTLRGSRRHGCCGGTAFVPVAEPGAPVDRQHFRAHRVDGVTVWLDADATVRGEPLVIGVDRLWRWERLRAEGTAIWM